MRLFARPGQTAKAILLSFDTARPGSALTRAGLLFIPWPAVSGDAMIRCGISGTGLAAGRMYPQRKASCGTRSVAVTMAKHARRFGEDAVRVSAWKNGKHASRNVMYGVAIPREV